MTREEMIIDELNRAEIRLKCAIENKDEGATDFVTAYLLGLTKMAKMMGYRIEEDADKAVEVDGLWICHYTGLTDVRTN